MNPDFKPRIRGLEISRFSENGADYFHFHDPQKIAPDVSLSASLAPILALFDGTHTVHDIWQIISRQDPELPLAWLEELVENMDSHFLLNSPHFRAEKTRVEAEFVQNPTRGAAFAGLSYPEKRKELREFLGAKLEIGQKRLAAPVYDAQNVRAVVTPHIDFHRGGHVEAASYGPLVENVRATGKPFDTFVVLGIAHSGVHYPFCGADKDFATPLGTMNCDREFVADLENALGEPFLAEQFAHKDEHSIEFAAVWAQFYEELSPSRIVPILCGGFWDALRTKKRPEIAQSEVKNFIETLRETVQKHEAAGKKIGFIVSVDGAHVGTQFGDETPITPQKLKEIEFADRRWCAAAQAGNLDEFHAHFAADENRFNVDAHPAIYTLLAAFPQFRGQLLDYDQAFNAPRNIVVSFASMAFFNV